MAQGVIRTVLEQIELHFASRVVFAFDYGGIGLRGEINPQYKCSRRKRKRNLTTEERSDLKSFYKQIDKIRSKYLPKMGFRNIIRIQGYEADDVLAQIAEEATSENQAVILTADQDLWQCIREDVRWHNPITKTTVTAASFKKKWGIDPQMWAGVKALSGCKTDDVIGIKEIGEVSAAKWVAGTLKESSKKYKAILENLHVYAENMPLVKLPFPGLELPKLRKDKTTPKKIIEVEHKIGLRANRLPKKARKK